MLIYACGLLEHRRQLQAFPYRLVAVESSEIFAKDVFDDFPSPPPPPPLFFFFSFFLFSSFLFSFSFSTLLVSERNPQIDWLCQLHLHRARTHEVTASQLHLHRARTHEVTASQLHVNRARTHEVTASQLHVHRARTHEVTGCVSYTSTGLNS